MLQWVVRWVEVLIWWTVSLLERAESQSLGKVRFHLVSEVPLGE